jgi:hypothetical protein
MTCAVARGADVDVDADVDDSSARVGVVFPIVGDDPHEVGRCEAVPSAGTLSCADCDHAALLYTAVPAKSAAMGTAMGTAKRIAVATLASVAENMHASVDKR